jgi:replicative DNA helicase
VNDHERLSSINAAARDILHIALHHPITRVALLKVEADAFSDLAERTLFRTALGFYDLGIDFTLQHLYDELERLQDATPDAEEHLMYGHTIERLSEQFTSAPATYLEARKDVDVLLAEIARLAPAPSSAAPRFFACKDLIGDIISEATAAHEAKRTGELRGPITGIKELDQKFGGFLPVGLSIMLGNTGTGKTALAMQIAASCGFPALYVTTEMAAAELFRRQMARVSGTFLGRLKSGEMEPKDVEAIALSTAKAMPHLAFLDATTAPTCAAFIRECAKRVQGQAKTMLLIIDSLHTWTRGSNPGQSEYEALNQNLLSLQQLCHQLQCPSLALCEQSRAAIAGGGGVNSGAGSRSIEYGAEIVFDLQAGKEIGADGEKEVALQLAKNRHGAAGVSIKLSFNGALQRFKGKEDWGVYANN